MSNNSERVVVVTGAAAGIGLGVAESFAKAGYKVAMLDVQGELLAQAADALRAGGATIFHQTADVADRAQVDQAYDAIRRELGPITVVVPNAGIAPMVPFATMSQADWDRVISINLTGVFHTLQAALPDMVAAQWGRMITISSHAGQSGAPNMVHYSASKGGVIGMTKALARELAAQGITVNTIPPSLVETPQMHRATESGEFPLEMVTAMIPISRPGRPDEIGSACVFLASDEAAYITGQVLAVNGGSYI